MASLAPIIGIENDECNVGKSDGDEMIIKGKELTPITTNSNSKISNDNVEKQPNNVPLDKLNIAYRLMFILFGISVLLPYNATLNSLGITDDIFSGLNYPFKASIASNCGFLLGFVLLSFIAVRLSMIYRILLGYLGMFIIVICLLFLLLIARNNVTLYFYICLSVTGLLDVSVYLCTGSFNSLCYVLHPTIALSFFKGQSYSGLVSLSLTMTAYALFSGDYSNNLWQTRFLMFLFISSLAFNLATNFVFIKITRNPFIKARINDKNNTLKHKSESDIPEKFFDRIRSIIKVVKITYNALLSITYCGALSFLVFPGVLTKFRPTRASDMTPQFLSTLMIATYQVGDVLGRHLASRLSFGMTNIWRINISRLLIFPLFLISQAMQPENSIFTHISFRLILANIWGITNGSVLSWSFLHVNDEKLDYNMIQDAGILGAFAVIFGMSLGSWCSLLNQNILSHYFL